MSSYGDCCVIGKTLQRGTCTCTRPRVLLRCPARYSAPAQSATGISEALSSGFGFSRSSKGISSQCRSQVCVALAVQRYADSLALQYPAGSRAYGRRPALSLEARSIFGRGPAVAVQTHPRRLGGGPPRSPCCAIYMAAKCARKAIACRSGSANVPKRYCSSLASTPGASAIRAAAHGGKARAHRHGMRAAIAPDVAAGMRPRGGRCSAQRDHRRARSRGVPLRHVQEQTEAALVAWRASTSPRRRNYPGSI